jgi:multidrug transporter EmrE-like cation transporter
MAKSIIYIILYASFNVAGAALIKWQLQGRTLGSFREWIRFMINLPFMAAFALIILSALLLFKALSTNHFSLIIPLATGINFILTVGAGYYLFRDRLSVLSFLGFALIICGIILLSLNRQANA